MSVRAQKKLLRFPDIYRETIVFTYGGDLWVVSPSGGGSRLTAHPVVKVFAKFSREEYRPNLASLTPKANVSIEGHDVKVDNDPKPVIEGKEPQLERAVAELINRLKAQPVAPLTRPPEPVRKSKHNDVMM